MTPWRRPPVDPPVIIGDPLPVPAASVDGWTLSGSVLGGTSRDVERELATHLHGVALAVETPWTYSRAAELLEESGHSRMALTALDAWISHPLASTKSEQTRAIERQRARLVHRIARGSVSNAQRSQ